MVRKILRYPNPLLRKVLPDVPETISDLNYITDLFDTLEHSNDGAALAANQIGLEVRLFVLTEKLKEESNFNSRVIVNPHITVYGEEKETLMEGCLSLPGINVPIPRSKSVEVHFRSILGSGVIQSRKLDGFIARVFQHEIDHLDGKVNIDYLDRKKKFEIRSLMLKRR